MPMLAHLEPDDGDMCVGRDRQHALVEVAKQRNRLFGCGSRVLDVAELRGSPCLGHEREADQLRMADQARRLGRRIRLRQRFMQPSEPLQRVRQPTPHVHDELPLPSYAAHARLLRAFDVLEEHDSQVG